MSGKKADRLRMPRKREATGIFQILVNAEAAAADMRTYRNPAETKRARDVEAGIAWIYHALSVASVRKT